VATGAEDPLGFPAGFFRRDPSHLSRHRLHPLQAGPSALLLKWGRTTFAVLGVVDHAFFCGTPLMSPSDDGFPRNIWCRGFGRPLVRVLYTVVTAITSRVWIRCVQMPTRAPSALHKALRHSRIASPARDARAVTFCGVHGQGLGKISRSKQYRLGIPPPRVLPPDFKEDVSSMEGSTIQPRGELSLAC